MRVKTVRFYRHFRLLHKHKKFLGKCAYFSVMCAQHHELDKGTFAFYITKKVVKKAVDRQKIRRRLHALCAALDPEKKPYTYTIRVEQSIADTSFALLQQHMEYIFSKKAKKWDKKPYGLKKCYTPKFGMRTFKDKDQHL